MLRPAPMPASSRQTCSTDHSNTTPRTKAVRTLALPCQIRRTEQGTGTSKAPERRTVVVKDGGGCHAAHPPVRVCKQRHRTPADPREHAPPGSSTILRIRRCTRQTAPTACPANEASGNYPARQIGKREKRQARRCFAAILPQPRRPRRTRSLKFLVNCCLNFNDFAPTQRES